MEDTVLRHNNTNPSQTEVQNFSCSSTEKEFSTINIESPEIIVESPQRISEVPIPEPAPPAESNIEKLKISLQNIEYDPVKSMKQIRQEFYDKRAMEMRSVVNFYVFIKYTGNFIRLIVGDFDLENVILITYYLFLIIPNIISYKNEKMEYVRFAFFMMISKEIFEMFRLTHEDFVGVKNLSINGKAFVIHLLMLICVTTFNLIYSDCRNKIQIFMGYFLLICLSYGAQQIFYIDDELLENEKIALFSMCIFFTFMTVVYVRTCQNVIEQMFQQILNNIEQQNIIKSILNNLEESILITNENQNIDYINDKFLEQFNKIIESDDLEQKVTQSVKTSTCNTFKKCLKKFQKLPADIQQDQPYTNNFIKQKVLIKFKANDSTVEDDAPKVLSFQDILQSDEKSLEKIIVYTTIEDDDESIEEKETRYLQIKLKKFTRNSQALTMMQFIDISKSILHDQQKAQNQALEMINASVSHEMRNPLNSINAQNILKYELYKQLNKMITEFDSEITNQNFVSKKNKFLIRFKQIMAKLNNGYLIQESSSSILTHIVQDLLDFAQIKAGKFRKNICDFNIIDIVNSVMLIQQRKAQDNNIILSAHYPENFDPMISTDKQRVMQVLLGLQSNALKFTKDGRVDITVWVEMGYLKIEVADTGIGISKENQKNLFQLFGMVQESRQLNTNGVGLGLVISKQIINQFGGEIDLISDVGVGTKFTFTFKLEESQAKLSTAIDRPMQNSDEIYRQKLNDKNLHFKWTPESIEQHQRIKYIKNLDQKWINFQEEHCSESSEEKLVQNQNSLLTLNSFMNGVKPVKNKQILIVDDQSFNIDALMIIMKYKIGLDSNYYCKMALSGLQAIEMIKKDIRKQKKRGKKRSQFQLILMDCNMPELDGYETTKMIRQLLWDNNMVQPIISAVTGHTEQLYINKAIQSGMNQVISKPVEQDILNYLVQVLDFPLIK